MPWTWFLRAIDFAQCRCDVDFHGILVKKLRILTQVDRRKVWSGLWSVILIFYTKQTFSVAIWNEPRHDKTNKMSVRPAKTQTSLGIIPVWSESSLCAQWVAKDPSFLHADSEDPDQTDIPVWSGSSLSAWRKLGSLATHWAHSKDSDQTGRTLILLVLSCRGSNVFS